MLHDERGAALVALRPLEADPEFHHHPKTLARNFSETTRLAIKAVEEETREFNKSVKDAGKSLISAEAATYWDEVQEAIRRGKVAQATGDRAAEKQVSLMSEALESTFETRVPEYDQPKFQHLDIQQHAETWDERWEWIEFPAPLLREEFCRSYEIPHVKNYAQRSVFTDIAQPNHREENVAEFRAKIAEARKVGRLADGLKAQEALQAEQRKQARAGAKYDKMIQKLDSKPKKKAAKAAAAPKAMELGDISDEQPVDGGEA